MPFVYREAGVPYLLGNEVGSVYTKRASPDHLSSATIVTNDVGSSMVSLTKLSKLFSDEGS